MRTGSRFQNEYRAAVTGLAEALARVQQQEPVPPAVYDALVTARLKLWMVRERMREEAEARAQEAAASKRRFLEVPGAPTPRYRPRRTVPRTDV